METTFSKLADAVKPNGGNAVEGVTRINQANVSWTYTNFREMLGGPLCFNSSNTAIIGSAGKKAWNETSGDIDIAVEVYNRDMLKFNIFDLYVEELTRLGYAFKDMRQIGIISIAYPIMNYDDKQEGQLVQIDLMVVGSLDYAMWSYYSPQHLHSEYKGLYRNELNFFIAKHAELRPTVVQDGIVTEWERYWFSTSEGLLLGKQTLLSAKTGKITKTPRVHYKRVVTNDPDEVARFLYGPDVDSDGILTFEDALRAMNGPTFPYKDRINDIIADTIKGIEKKGYPVPDLLRI
jgi:hypothetical protein